MQLKLKITSFNENNLFQICERIIQKGNLFSFILKGPIYLPKKITLFTILKSPHVNKKSRNQFKLIVYKRIIIIDLSYFKYLKNAKEEIKLFLQYIKNISGAVQIQIHYIQ